MTRLQALTELRLIAGTARTSLVAGERDLEMPPLRPGQPVEGRIEQQVRAGYVVSVNGRSYEIKLPDGGRVGDALRLVYIKDSPRPTFALLRIDRANDNADSKLSAAGKLLGMLQEIPIESVDGFEAHATAPLFGSRVPEAAHAAPLLREALALSGLFYESHQAQWILGLRSTEQLRREPQGRLAPLRPAVTAPQRHAPADSRDITAGPLTGPGEEAGHGKTDAPAPDAQSTRAPAHASTFSIIREQLGVLESGLVAWRGQIWPGQFMHWQVSDDAPRQVGAGAVPRTWRTELKLSLPNIGGLLAKIELHANGARLQIIVDSQTNAGRLREQAPALALQFHACGIPLNALEFRHGPESA